MGDTVFKVGDRVVVTENYRGAGCNHGAIGYYGHVVSVDPGAHDDDAYTQKGACIRIAFRGHIDGCGPKDDYYLKFNEGRPFPCYWGEVTHVD
jgi:hypothetical protein